MKKIIISCLLTAVVVTLAFIQGAGYFIGNYLVAFGLERGTMGDKNEPPRAFALLMPPESRQFDRPDYLSETWELHSEDGLRLTATHFSPEKSSNKWVIVAHGYGCNQTNSYYIAEHYLMMGFHVLTPDLRASGDSEGRYLTLGYKESGDVIGWAKQIVMRYPEAHIVLHGVSMGAATMMLAAADDALPAQVVACVEDSGYTSAFVMFTMQLKIIFGLPGFPIMNCVDIVSHFKTGVAISEAAPVLYVRNIDVPILFIHGTDDKLVPYYMMQELYDLCHAPIKEQFSVEGAGHADAKAIDPDQYFNRIFSFLDQYINNEGIRFD